MARLEFMYLPRATINLNIYIAGEITEEVIDSTGRLSGSGKNVRVFSKPYISVLENKEVGHIDNDIVVKGVYDNENNLAIMAKMCGEKNPLFEPSDRYTREAVASYLEKNKVEEVTDVKMNIVSEEDVIAKIKKAVSEKGADLAEWPHQTISSVAKAMGIDTSATDKEKVVSLIEEKIATLVAE